MLARQYCDAKRSAPARSSAAGEQVPSEPAPGAAGGPQRRRCSSRNARRRRARCVDRRGMSGSSRPAPSPRAARRRTTRPSAAGRRRATPRTAGRGSSRRRCRTGRPTPVTDGASVAPPQVALVARRATPGTPGWPRSPRWRPCPPPGVGVDQLAARCGSIPIETASTTVSKSSPAREPHGPGVGPPCRGATRGRGRAPATGVDLLEVEPSGNTGSRRPDERVVLLDARPEVDLPPEGEPGDGSAGRRRGARRRAGGKNRNGPRAPAAPGTAARSRRRPSRPASSRRAPPCSRRRLRSARCRPGPAGNGRAVGVAVGVGEGEVVQRRCTNGTLQRRPPTPRGAGARSMSSSSSTAP